MGGIDAFKLRVRSIGLWSNVCFPLEYDITRAAEERVVLWVPMNKRGFGLSNFGVEASDMGVDGLVVPSDL